VHDIVRDQPVPTLDEIEHALALADPGAAAKQESHAEHVGQRAMDGGARREGVVEKRLEPPVELGRLEPRADDGDTLVARQNEQLFRRILSFRDDHARQRVGKNRLNRLAARLRVE